MKKSVFAVLLFLALGGLFLWSGNRFIYLVRLSLATLASPEKKLSLALDYDLSRLRTAKSLPQGFEDLKEIKVTATSAKLKETMKKYPLDLQTSPKGHYNLEIFLDEIQDGGVMIQYDLVDVKSGNTTWELGRTFPHKL